MPPKKGDKKDDKGKDEKKAGTFTEVEKTFLELQLADCNRKNARLLQAVGDYELKYEQLQKDYERLDEDRADIIAFLKKQLNSKIDENQELKEKVKGLEELREIEMDKFRSQNSELDKNFKIMKEQLTSENKLLAGKLNTLEEFRAIKDDLMQKFENQEKAFQEQEMKYKRLLYESEKKFVIGKDKLKKEMEARLLQLAQDFQDATELRIAASTHRVIRENIAINNEMDNILKTQAKLAEMNEKFKDDERAARVAKTLAEEERDEALNKNVVQLRIIDQLTKQFQEVKKERVLFEKRNYDFETLQAKIQKTTKENENLSLQVRILEQNLHALKTDQNKALMESSTIVNENEKLKNVLKETARAVRAALKLDEWARQDKTRDELDRQVLLARLLEIVTEYHHVDRATSSDTISSIIKVYEEGDLGFVPKPVVSKKKKTISDQTLLLVSRQSGLKETVKSDSLTETPSQSSLGSIKTIPSLKLLPPESGEKLSVNESADSIQSQKSAESESGPELDDIPDIRQQLAASKLEIKKSVMKDLAGSMFASRLTFKPEIESETDTERGEEGEEQQMHLPDDDDEHIQTKDGAQVSADDELEKKIEEGEKKEQEIQIEETEVIESKEDKSKGEEEMEASAASTLPEMVSGSLEHVKPEDEKKAEEMHPTDKEDIESQSPLEE